MSNRIMLFIAACSCCALAIAPATPVAQTSGAAAYDGPGWRVGVGVFHELENVESVSSLLRGSGFEVHLTKVTIASGEATLVWLGPFAEKEAAEKISAKLPILTGEPGYITDRVFCDHCPY